MNMKIIPIAIALAVVAFLCADKVKGRVGHAQSINGIPNQTMGNFTSVVVNTMQIGTSVPLNYAGILSSASTTPASIGASGCADTAFTFTGVAVGATVSVPIPPSTQTANIIMAGVEPVTTANTVSIRFCNESTLTAQTPVAGIYKAFFAW